MIKVLYRKIRQVSADSVLRRWLVGRGLGKWPGEPKFSRHCPDYLRSLLPYHAETSSVSFNHRTFQQPGSPVTLELAGRTIELNPGDEKTVFKTEFEDIETRLSLHRFAWLPASEENIDADWIDLIWSSWCETYAQPDDSWVWHPYTASERAINMLVHARQYGFAGSHDTFRDSLVIHAENISKKLEYFGNHHTSNHMANNGRGLYLIGLWLGLENATKLGAKILLEEAQRIFTPTGILREGSSHYHFLLARNYNEVCAAARDYDRPEAPQLAEIANKTLRHLPAFKLPGGFPLIGDISPDLSPDRLLAELSELDFGSVSGPQKTALPEADGWLRFNSGPWSGLWHVEPQGWSFMPGHGHQDLGSFELHFEKEPLFIDLGRGSYGEQGEAAFYRSAQAHNGITLDNQDPYPANRPYYNKPFRNLVGGPPPKLNHTDTSVSLSYTSRGKYFHSRNWRFSKNRLRIEDRVEALDQHSIIRRLNTTLAPEQTPDGILLSGLNTYKISCPESAIKITPVKRWTAYGRGIPAHQIEFHSRADLDFKGEIQIDVISHGN